MPRPPRKNTEMPLKAAIEEFLDRYHLRDRMNEAMVIQAWEGVTGEMIARHTTSLRIRNRVLYVTVDSAALRNELSFARTKLVASLNRKAGSNVIDEIILK